MRIPVDTDGLMIMAGGPARPVTDEQGQQRANRDGEPLYSVDLVVLADDERPDTWTVRLTAEPQGIGKGTPVRVTGLSVSIWEVADKGERRSGLSFRAEAIEALAGLPAGEDA